MNLIDGMLCVCNALYGDSSIRNMKYFHVKDGYIYATNGAMTASVMVDVEGEYVIPSDEFTKVIGSFGKGSSTVFDGDILQVKNGRRKANIKLLGSIESPLMEPVQDRVKVEKSFKQALEMVRPFICDESQRAWSMTAWVKPDADRDGKHYVYATNNHVIIEAEVGGLDEVIDVQIPSFALDFISSRKEELVEVGATDRKATFVFSDGTVLTTQLFAEKAPESFPDMVKNYKFNVVADNTESWVHEFESMSKMCENLTVYKDKIVGKYGNSDVESIIDTPSSSDKPSMWNPKYLKPVVSLCRSIDFSTFPKPCQFTGNGVRGLIVGKI